MEMLRCVTALETRVQRWDQICLIFMGRMSGVKVSVSYWPRTQLSGAHFTPRN